MLTVFLFVSSFAADDVETGQKTRFAGKRGDTSGLGHSDHVRILAYVKYSVVYYSLIVTNSFSLLLRLKALYLYSPLTCVCLYIGVGNCREFGWKVSSKRRSG